MLRRMLVLLMLIGLLLAGCGPKATPKPTVTPTPTATGTGGTPAVPGPDPTPPPGARIASYFPVSPGAGRDLILEWCGTCHNLALVLLTRKDAAGWATYMKNRRPDISFLGDEDVKTIQDYLVANFTPDKPTPQLPPELTR